MTTLEEAIILIVENELKSINLFHLKAQEMSEKLGKGCIPNIKKLLHNPPKTPVHLKEQFKGLGSWLPACQIAAFELLYHFKKDALPVIKEIAYGNYDWTQGNAIELLVRLAADGIEREKIIKELNKNMQDIRYEAIYNAVGPLLGLSDENPKVKEVLKLITAEEFQEAILEIEEEWEKC
jgi:hypothetical protein